ncbi:hypothetical protein NLX71_04015 [Paenibacillus sp. MZ04-78.2]|uniref:hypothetical protein n=1 Tax=Paenibacillus sp. MZ04-78.2 TaxID=2962034 RepID=UPI0020B799CA|nr:hypothetical protein [Paenibacillus sp. MZ04-78.2]MCP3772483.1 hypothetical protein [Paenibacillus sp. MZ04-78.2]
MKAEMNAGIQEMMEKAIQNVYNIHRIKKYRQAPARITVGIRNVAGAGRCCGRV